MSVSKKSQKRRQRVRTKACVLTWKNIETRASDQTRGSVREGMLVQAWVCQNVEIDCDVGVHLSKRVVDKEFATQRMSLQTVDVLETVLGTVGDDIKVRVHQRVYTKTSGSDRTSGSLSLSRRQGQGKSICNKTRMVVSKNMSWN